MLVERLPGWFFGALAFVLLIVLLVVLLYLVVGAKRVAESVGLGKELYVLSQQLCEAKEASRVDRAIAEQLSTTLKNVGLYMRRLSQLQPNMNWPAVSTYIQGALDALTQDIKHQPGERHRCAFWLEHNDCLLFMVGSAGFPHSYSNGGRRLDIHRSIAGRALRLGKTINRANVREDEDWEPNPESDSPYTAIIAVPLYDVMKAKPFGVLTVDALNPMGEREQRISEAYAALIEHAYNQLAFMAARPYNGVEGELREGGASNEATHRGEPHPSS